MAKLILHIEANFHAIRERRIKENALLTNEERMKKAEQIEKLISLFKPKSNNN
jgi:hypothetical protein